MCFIDMNKAHVKNTISSKKGKPSYDLSTNGVDSSFTAWDCSPIVHKVYVELH